MGHSSLMGVDFAPLEPAGRDNAALGPGDSSDTGSDMVGIDMNDEGDPGMPVDVALREDTPHPLVLADALGLSASDAAGTGERRSAGSDADLYEAADIGVDQVFAMDGGDGSEGVLLKEDLALIAELEAGDPLEDEEEEEEEDDGERA